MGDVTPARGDQIAGPARLTAAHELGKFSCGKPELDDWLRNHALASEGRTARTYVVCENNVTVIGYTCIATGSVERGALSIRVKRARGVPNQIPVAIIGRLARDARYRGTGLGADLLRDAMSRFVAASETIGIRCILVHAIDDDAARFYQKYQFVECPIGSRTFVLPIETAIDAL